MLRQLLLLVAVLTLPVAAAAQDAREDDALWLAYAPLLVQALVEFPPELDVDASLAIAVPEEWLDTLAPQFESDPRYWELRWWNASIHEDENAVDWLRRGAERGKLGFAGSWMLFENEREELEGLWGRYIEGSASEADLAVLPSFRPEETLWPWYKDRRFEMLDAVVAGYPEESWPRFERAMLHFEHGQWESGLADLEAGSVAMNNRAPLPYPWSYVRGCLGDDIPLSHEVAAGIVAASWMAVWRIPNYIPVKDHVRNQRVRFALGASLSEAGPWHRYCCKAATAEGAESVLILVMLTVHTNVVDYLLTDATESLTVEQREDLLALSRRIRQGQSVYKHELEDLPEARDFLQQSVEERGLTSGDLAEYILFQEDPADNEHEYLEPLDEPSAEALEMLGVASTEEYVSQILEVMGLASIEEYEQHMQAELAELRAQPLYRLRLKLLEDYYRYGLEYWSAQIELDRRATEYFRREYDFDFETFSFPELPAVTEPEPHLMY